MRKLLISTLMAASLVASAPAAAQYGGHRGDYGQRGDYGERSGHGIERQIDEIKQRIDRARDRRAISGEEARRLRYEANALDRMADRARRGGLSPREARYLQARVDRLRQQLRHERWD